MTPQEALNVLTNVTASVQGDRGLHQTIQSALLVIEQLVEEKNTKQDEKPEVE